MIKVKVNNEYKDVVKIFCGGTLQKEIIKVWSREAQEYVYESSVEYTGSLPITISANGDALLDYRIYGASSGVGVATENLFDAQGTDNFGYYNADDGTFHYNIRYKFWRIAVSEGDVIHMTRNGRGSGCAFYNGEYVTAIYYQISDYVVPSGVDEITNNYNYSFFNDAMVTKNQPLPTNYVPYGYKLPMVVHSMNLFDKNAQDVDDGFISKTRLNSDGTTQNQYNFNVSEYIAVQPETSYYFKNISTDDSFGPAECFYDSEKNFISSYTPHFEKNFVVTAPTNAAYVRVSYYIDNSEQMIIKGTEPPSEYIPYSKQIIPVYIGENQLDTGEYVSYGAQKIYRDVGGTLTPTDPPVPLPEIPTIDDATIIDYDGEPKPSQMYVKYRR